MEGRLLLNQKSYLALADEKKPAFLKIWLKCIESVLSKNSATAELKNVQEELVQQLESRIPNTNCPETRQLLARCLAWVYYSGDSGSLLGTINVCNDLLRVKDVSPSHIASKLTAIACLSALYEKVGKLVGRTYEESFILLTEWLKIAESQSRAEILNTLRSMIIGLGTATNNMHKEMYKLTRSYANDRVSSVRIAAIRCLAALVPVFSYMYINDWDQLFTSCVKALEGSTNEIRIECAKLLATMIATALGLRKSSGSKQPGSEQDRPMTLEKALGYLSDAFKNGGAAGGFLTGGEFSKGSSSKKVCMGIAVAYVELAKELLDARHKKKRREFCHHVIELNKNCGRPSNPSCSINTVFSLDDTFKKECFAHVLRSVSFLDGTSNNNELRIQGLEILQEIINEVEDTPDEVTGALCHTVRAWIGGYAKRDLNDLKALHELLLSSLKKLEDGSINSQRYCESAATLDKLSILKAWADVYITELDREENSKTIDCDDVLPSGILLSLIKPKMESMIGYWLSAVHDAAVINLPQKYAGQDALKKCAFFTLESIEEVQIYYRSNWPSILLATALWMKNNNFQVSSTGTEPTVWMDENPETRFSVLLGIAVETLCSKTSYVDDTTVQTCVKALIAILSTEWCQMQLMSDVQQAVEIVHALHRVIYTTYSTETQQLCINCAGILLDSALMAIRINSLSDVENDNVEMSANFPQYSGKGGDDDTLHGTLSFALMELCLCLFVRHMPQINPSYMESRSLVPLHPSRLPPESTNVVRSSIELMVRIPQLTAADTLLASLPIILPLLVAFIKETARIDENGVVPDLPPGHLSIIATASLQGLRVLASNPPSDSTLSPWLSIYRSALFSLLKLCDGESRYDRCVILLSCVVMASAAPKSVVLGHSESFHRLVRLMREQLQSEHPKVVCKALQSLASLLSRKDISTPFVKNLGEDVFNVMKPFVAGQAELTTLSADQFEMLKDAEKIIESIAQMANERKRTQTVSLLTQSLYRLIPIEPFPWNEMSSSSKMLYDFIHQRLHVVVDTWPTEYKSVVAAHPDIKKREFPCVAKKAENQRENSQQQQLTIKYTMDFDAFQKAYNF